MKKYVAYYRVSTTQQGNSGLGLEAQKSAVVNHISNNELIKEFTEIESGKNIDRKALREAIDYSKKNSATLIIAKLDRLARSVYFISSLMESGVDFVACDMPYANKFMIHIYAAIAENERELISQRTKAALAELKKKGVELGSPENLTAQARKKGLKKRKENAANNVNNLVAKNAIIPLRNDGMSYEQIANKLNEMGLKTRRGNPFTRMQVYRLYNN